MKKLNLAFLLLLALLFVNSSGYSQESVKTPKDFFGFKPGADGHLFNYDKLIDYLDLLESNSPKMKMIEIGKSPMGKPMYSIFISSEENIKNLSKLKEINEELALNHNLTEDLRNQYKKEGKVFVIFTLSMHSNEVGPSQALPLIAHELITSTDEKITSWLEDVVYMAIPCHNPDGMNMIVDHYNKYKNTKYDGSSMPGIYHKYIGHNINRDFVALTQEETKIISNLFSKEWLPQVMIEKHQMGSGGPRYFVSPPHDPIAENIDAGIWNWMKVFGTRAITEMTEVGLKGISHSYLFDDYWPGPTETCIWKNTIGMLTEGASVKYATPIYIEPNELNAYGKGMGEYKKSINMPSPWEGGWWRLNDLIQYEIESTKSYLNTAAQYKEELLLFRNDMAKREVEKGETEAPFYYVFPKQQHDQSEMVNLVNLLDEHGVKVYKLDKDVEFNNTLFKTGDIIVPLAQPFRAFIKEMLEKQIFPERHYTPGGKMIRPYDITSWSLPLHKGVQAFEINEKRSIFENSYSPLEIPFSLSTEVAEDFESILLSANNNNSYKAVFTALKNNIKVEQILEEYNGYPQGSFVIHKSKNIDLIFNELTVAPEFLNEKLSISKKEIKLPRIGIIESYFHDMDAGWTRFIMDTYNMPFKMIRPHEIKDLDLSKQFDLLIFPDNSKSVLINGKYSSGSNQYFMKYPPEYMKGMEKEGLEKVLKFIEDGGKAIAWKGSSELFSGIQTISKEQFELPVKDVSKSLKQKGFSCTGSLLKIKVKQDHPITYGLQKEVGVFHRDSPIFTTWQPYFDVDRRVIATFPEREILMSGFIQNEKLLSNKPAIVWLKKGKGQIVLLSFNPQFRASTPGTYKFLFNSILL